MMRFQPFSIAGCLSLFALCSLFLVSCQPEENTKTSLVTFENVQLDSTGIWIGSDLSGSFTSEDLTSFITYSESMYGAYWSGIACSNQTDMETPGYYNQYSVYATSGANGSSQFGLIYGDGAYCQFNQPVTVNSMMVNNSTFACLALKDANVGDFGTVKKFTDDDYFYVTVTGYDADSVRTDSLNIYLADFRDGKTYICDQWTSVSLESLGQVKTLTFKFTSTDTGDWGINTPTYLCIDNINYTKED
jgi:hypothetical protein